MRLHGVVLLAAATARSQAYAQALLHAGLTLETAVIFQKPGHVLPGMGTAAAPGSPVASLFLPDLSVPLAESCGRLADEVLHVEAASVNDPTILQTLASPKPALVVYSGFGGQIVGDDLLRLGSRFLHIHAGWLPDYRGSTTTYYSLLSEGKCGVSALLLRQEIDAGEIVGRRWFPRPWRGVDIDFVYDSAIRADLLVTVLKEWAVRRAFDAAIEQGDGPSETYYVIHPVLKHVAMLGLETREQV